MTSLISVANVLHVKDCNYFKILFSPLLMQNSGVLFWSENLYNVSLGSSKVNPIMWWDENSLEVVNV